MSARSPRFERKSKARPFQVTYCIVVEGEKTEKNYFIGAKREFEALLRTRAVEHRRNGRKNSANVALEIVSAGGLSFGNVVQKALDQSTLGHRKVWCVVDADLYIGLQGAQRNDADAVYEKAIQAGIDIIFSRPCFEVWFRHHFNSHSSQWINGGRAKVEIQRLWPEYLEKPNQHWELLRGRLVDHALPNAQKVRTAHGERLVEDCDASTDVDWLIYELFCQIDPDDPTTP